MTQLNLFQFGEKFFFPYGSLLYGNMYSSAVPPLMQKNTHWKLASYVKTIVAQLF